MRQPALATWVPLERGSIIISWTILSWALTAAAVALLVCAALHDLAVRTVPNLISAGILVVGVGLRLIDHSLLESLGVAGFCFIVLALAWRARFIGGGDVKLWSATVLLIPPYWQAEFLFVYRVLLGGGVLAVLYISLRFVVHRPRPSRAGSLLRRAMRAEAWRICRRGPLPYAFAIASGAIFSLAPISSLAVR
jgi:prepilin peptidase CpaA